ncbi:MAG: SBBP repeat-containing protein [Candidatus Cloacimonetes bacterium]|nr:SBBP repeat-containing protein [Candidatus Cloacimonadota bacterium]MCF7813317.1 SBBP repeat-containing protein [Candidatus Cloacimonadota bacterium]MCF7867392.1 SBBP repeat-containing protein [Candidatus Cloacimonadota bacterium]MCF7882826.1 SBBP repeat-containing protein [Candidatus Cloacimonadota bacterium]
MKKRVLIFVFTLALISLSAQIPDWQWADAAGSDNDDNGNAIALDASGNIYVIGSFFSTVDFGSHSITSNGWLDIFVAKMNSSGEWQWALNAGSGNNDEGYDIAVDSDGNVYITGYFMETASFGSNSISAAGWSDIFVAKLDTDGNWLWVSNAGSGSNSYDDVGNSLTVDNSGDVCVTGTFSDTANFGSSSITSYGDLDIFAAKISSSGSWQWASVAGGVGFDLGMAITADVNGNSYVTGSFCETATFGTNTLENPDLLDDIFVAKLDASGTWQWASDAGGVSSGDTGNGIAVDENGNCYVTGNFQAGATFGNHTIPTNGSHDIFVAKIDNSGTWQWAVNGGGDIGDIGRDIAIDASGASFVIGSFYGDSATFGSYTLTGAGYHDIVVGKVDSDGNWEWVVSAGGSAQWDKDIGRGIALDSGFDSYITGNFAGTANFGSIQLTSNGQEDIFVAEINSNLPNGNNLIPPKFNITNYPNPFNPQTTIEFSVTQTSPFAKLEIFNLKGQVIHTQEFSSGNHSYVWNASDQASGIYFYKISSGDFSETKKMILMK